MKKGVAKKALTGTGAVHVPSLLIRIPFGGRAQVMFVADTAELEHLLRTWLRTSEQLDLLVQLLRDTLGEETGRRQS